MFGYHLNFREDIYNNLVVNIGYISPFKIQTCSFQSIEDKPYANLIAQAPNGCGKTGAFDILVLHRVNENDTTFKLLSSHTIESMCKKHQN